MAVPTRDRPRAAHARVDVLGVRVSAIDPDDALCAITEWIIDETQHYVCVTGVHGVMEAQRDPELMRIHNDSGLTTPDGMPMVWAARFAGADNVRRVYGPDLMLSVCERAALRGWRSYLYGTTDETLDRLRRTLTDRFPGLKIVGTHAPPFRPLTPDEDDAEICAINESEAQIVWVGLSTPNQERWMAAHMGRVKAPVVIGVGAAFDIHAGNVAQAPRWMQRSGLEWSFRLALEPRRLWRRYSVNVPRFLVAIARRRPQITTASPRSTLYWRRAPLSPRRFELWTTPGREGAAALRVLYQARRRPAKFVSTATRYAPAIRARNAGLPDDVETTVARVAEVAGIRSNPAAALHARETDRWLFSFPRADANGAVVKLGHADDQGLAREGACLNKLAGTNTGFGVPTLRWHGRHEHWYAIVTDVVQHRVTAGESDLGDAYAIACALSTTRCGFVVHGDLAPWNIIPTATGLALVDWENSRFEPDPLYDLAHYVTRTGALLGTWRPHAAVEHLTGYGSVGWRYLEQIRVEPTSAAEHLDRYLRRAETGRLSPALRRYEAAMAATLRAFRTGG
jgi:N-acetylglucosaminyldiphosphoundecaprenol N-acetyl-beta-D-mannosaminyltransferase